MNSTLFDTFKKNLYEIYPYLKNYHVSFEHFGDNDSDLVFFLSVSPRDNHHNIEELLHISKNIKDFGKLFLINISTLSDIIRIHNK